MAKQSTYIIQGKQVNSTVISAYAKRVGSIDDILSVWANAATLQVVKHGNRNWLDSLFNMPTLRLKSGDLSKAGKDVLGYIKAHCPNVVWKKDTHTVSYSKPADTNILSSSFLAVGHTAPVEGLITELTGKFYTAHGDFAMTFTDFKNIVKEKPAPKDGEPSLQASAFNKQVDKALLTFGTGRFIGTPEELFDAYAKVKAMSDKLDAAFKEAAQLQEDKLAKLRTIEETGPVVPVAAEDMPLDTALADQLLQSGQAGSSNRANGKVAPVLAEAV